MMRGHQEPLRLVGSPRLTLRPAALAGSIVATEGDVLHLNLTQGRVKDPGGIFYVERHGLFRLAARQADKPCCAFLTLHAWPSV